MSGRRPGGGAERLAVVTGGNRGIGFYSVKKLCRAFDGTVVLVARNRARADTAASRLQRAKCSPVAYQLDVTDREGRRAFAEHLNATYGGLDVLVNSVGIRFLPNATAVHFKTEVKLTLHINFYCMYFLCQALFPLLRPHARIVNLSSPCAQVSTLPSGDLQRLFGRRRLTRAALFDAIGSFATSAERGEHEEDGWGVDPYCVSKLAVTALTALQQRDLSQARPYDDLVVNSLSPGDARSRQNAFSGSRGAKEAADDVVALATLPRRVQSPVGDFVWHNMSVVNWRSPRSGFEIPPTEDGTTGQKHPGCPWVAL